MSSPIPPDFNPYHAPAEASVSPTEVALEGLKSIPWVRAPLWRRFLAGVVDLPLAFACGLLGFALLYGVFSIFNLAFVMTIEPRNPLEAVVFVVLQLLFVVMFYGPMLAYSILLESSRLQATLGKSLLGLAVVDTNGGRLSRWHSLLRTLVKAIGTMVFGLGLVWMFSNRNRQALHDRMADSVVVLRDEQVPHRNRESS